LKKIFLANKNNFKSCINLVSEDNITYYKILELLADLGYSVSETDLEQFKEFELSLEVSQKDNFKKIAFRAKKYSKT
jgi:hypothetical protein